MKAKRKAPGKGTAEKAKRKGAASGAVAARGPGGGEEVRLVPVDAFVESPWQLHAEADAEDLALSIRTQGLLQPLLGRETAEGVELIDGHRRYRAVRDCIGEVDALPCRIVELDDEGAQAAALAANAQRLASDPLLEAEAIARLAAAGRSQRWIAAALGLGAGTVARRARLAALEECWRKDARGAAEGSRPSAATLEEIARFDAGVQRLAWRDLSMDGRKNAFESRLSGAGAAAAARNKCMEYTTGISEARFDAAPCRKCRRNTANEGLLFPDDAGGEGRCQDLECWRARTAEAVKETLRKARERGDTVREVRDRYKVPEHWNSTDARTARNRAAYVYTDWDGTLRVAWSVEPEKPEKEAAEKARAAAERDRRRRLVDAARRRVAGAFGAWLENAGGGGAEALKKTVEALKKTAEYRGFADRCAERLVADALKYGAETAVGDEELDDWAESLPGGLESLGLCAEEREAYEAELARKG